MKRYFIKYTREAEDGVNNLINAGDKIALRKLDQLFKELELHPKKGSGTPRKINFRGKKYWRRKITDKHRLIYDIKDNIVTVTVIKIGGHYDEK